MLLFLLCIIVLIFLLFSLILTRDIFSPSSVLCESYLLAILCAIYNVDLWDFEIHTNTFLVILVGLIAFIIPSFLFVLIRIKRKNHKCVKKISYIDFPASTINLLTMVSLIIFIVYIYFFLKAIGNFSSFSEFSAKMEYYREMTQFSGIDYIPTLVNFLSKYCRALAYICTYILINNILYCKFNKMKMRKFINIIIPIFIYIPLSLTSGARFDLIVYFITCLIIFSILYKKIYKKNLNIKKLIKIVIIIFVILFAFSQSRTLVGRTSKSDTITYISSYFGGSIASFDMYIQDVASGIKTNGKELFFGIYKFLNQLGISNINSSSDSMEFRVADSGVLIGNVYTGFRKMHHDFGLGGLIFFQVLLACIFNMLYYSISDKNSEKNKIDLEILIYADIMYCLFLHSFSEFFYSTILSFNYMSIFIIMVLIRFALNKIKVK